jgi:ABC-type phosphate transport system substrate-binding protein
MTAPRIICLLLALGVLWPVTARESVAGEGDFKVIVHPGNPVTRIDRDFLRRAYLKKATEWRHGPTIRPIDLRSRTPARHRFTRDVLKKTPAQLRSYWHQQVFTGKGVPPLESESTAAAIRYVLAHPGAVAYLPADVDPGKAKVVALD